MLLPLKRITRERRPVPKGEPNRTAPHLAGKSRLKLLDEPSRPLVCRAARKNRDRWLTDLALVAGLDPQLLIAVEADVLAALDDYGSDAERGSDTGSDGCTDRPAGNCADN